MPAHADGPDICAAIREAIAAAIPDAEIEVQGGGGHYAIAVTSAIFEGKNTLNRKREVLRSIKHLMAGDHAPVHAIDQLLTRTP